MNRPIIPRDDVAAKLAIPRHLLTRYERRGLVRVSREGALEGYEPSQVRRIWTIVSFQRDLGINLAGVEVILRLCDQMSAVHGRLGLLVREMNELLRDETPGDRSDFHE